MYECTALRWRDGWTRTKWREEGSWAAGCDGRLEDGGCDGGVGGCDGDVGGCDKDGDDDGGCVKDGDGGGGDEWFEEDGVVVA